MFTPEVRDSRKPPMKESPSIPTGHDKPDKEYVSFAKKFPALIHTCGLAQAVAFALAKKEANYIADLSEVLKAAGIPNDRATPLDQHARTLQLGRLPSPEPRRHQRRGLAEGYVEAATPEIRRRRRIMNAVHEQL